MTDDLNPLTGALSNVVKIAEDDRPSLTTERLLLRPFLSTDSARVYEVCQDREIASRTRNIPHPYPESAASDWVAGHVDLWRAGEAAIFAICPTEGGPLVGAVGLEINQQDHNAELGYWLARSSWGCGICTEAVGAVIRFGFEELGLFRVHSHFMTRNPASGRVMEKNGMRHEGSLRSHVRKWGVFEDIEVYGLLRSEYEACEGA